MRIALTRPVSPSIARCELTHLAREPLDVARAADQHAAYERLLASLGVTIVGVPTDPALPDAVFIEDTAIVLDEVAVIALPGARSRRAETAPVAAMIETYRPLLALEPPATLDGGDVLRIGRDLYVGRSGRTNEAGIEQLRERVAQFGYRVVPVEFDGCLHLKSAVTALTDDLLLINPAWVRPDRFAHCEMLAVDEREPYAANALRIGDTVVYPTAFPRTHALMREREVRVATTDMSELAKAEGAVTCCSLVFRTVEAAG